MGAARKKAPPSPEAIEAAGELVRAVKRAGSLEQLAEALDAVGRADEELYRLATAKIDFTKLPKFGGTPVEEEGALSWDEQMVLIVGDSLTDLTIKPRPGAAPTPPPPAAEESPTGEAPAEGEPAAEGPARAPDEGGEGQGTSAGEIAVDFEAELRRQAAELGVEITAVAVRTLPQEVVIQLTVPRGGNGITSQTKRSMAKWRSGWGQIAAELAQQLHLEAQEGQG